MMTNGIQVLIIADDLTGALDTASPFACRGLKVRVFTSVDAMPGAGLECDVVSVSTNSRHCSAVDAAALAARAARLGAVLKPLFVLKKIDSRLKGNVEAECRAVAEALHMESLCVAPAAPDVGRCVIAGHVVGSGVPEPISIADRFGSLANVRIADATTREDLLQLADLLIGNKNTLMACSRGFAVALAERVARGTATAFIPKSPILIGIGSRDPVTRAQVEKFRKAGACQILEAPHGIVAGAARKTDCILVMTTGEGDNATDVAEHFSKSIQHLFDVLVPNTILLSGGDTASAVLGTFGCHDVEVCGEAAPGLPWFEAVLNGRRVQLISKSGGFGTEDCLVDVLGETIHASERETGNRG
jgi:D-threonate/D-erythronate kinase